MYESTFARDNFTEKKRKGRKKYAFLIDGIIYPFFFFYTLPQEIFDLVIENACRLFEPNNPLHESRIGKLYRLFPLPGFQIARDGATRSCIRGRTRGIAQYVYLSEANRRVSRNKRFEGEMWLVNAWNRR